ncbi:MAG: retroviral-like aspartic protease family protein [Candidatus Poribacteria bacterium]|nr:retroviral-like aspartic protease family protein [Candidatus Poribacteria bacterium]
MEQTTRLKLANQDDLVAVRLGVMNPTDVRRLTVENALVDTGATGLCLPAPLINQLGLTPLRKIQAETANGIVTRTIYSEVEYTVLERSDSIRVTDLPDGMPVLLGHMILEALDLCVDMKKGLIHNPAHDGAWMIKIL